jgi:hypothetical protein
MLCSTKDPQAKNIEHSTHIWSKSTVSRKMLLYESAWSSIYHRTPSAQDLILQSITIKEILTVFICVDLI